MTRESGEFSKGNSTAQSWGRERLRQPRSSKSGAMAVPPALPDFTKTEAVRKLKSFAGSAASPRWNFQPWSKDSRKRGEGSEDCWRKAGRWARMNSGSKIVDKSSAFKGVVFYY